MLQLYFQVYIYIFHNVLTDSSQDQTMVDLFESLADDGFRADRSRAVSQQLSGITSCICNSDDEEAGPELEKEESELSRIMSQRWDCDMPSAGKSSPDFPLVFFELSIICFLILVCINYIVILTTLYSSYYMLLYG